MRALIIVGVILVALVVVGVLALALFPGSADTLSFSQPKSKGIVGGLLSGLLGG